MSGYVFRQGDTAFNVAETLEDANSNPVDIEGATITYTLTPIRGGTPLIDTQPADNLQVGDGSDGSKGKVEYSGSGVGTPGDYLSSFQVTFPGGETQTYPNDGYILVTVTPDATTPAHYVTVEELKKTLSMSGQSYADADITIAIAAASRGLEDAYETYWQAPVDDVRYYTRSGAREVHLGDLLSLTEVALDYSYSDLYMDGRVWDWDTGLGTYSTILDPAWFRLLPIQNGPAGNGEPYQTLQLSRASQRFILPSGQDAIKITGTFGWETVPSGVKFATALIAERLLKRTREAPFGILAIGAEGAAIRARDIAQDPDIRLAMGPAAGTSSLFV